ncbi:MAG: methylated-DNA--[protein]-cysteine S-methyltransferase [Pirellulaceae bacterium]
MSNLVTTTFPSELGWMAVLWRGAAVARLTFGHRSASAAWQSLELQSAGSEPLTGQMAELVARLRRFARGRPEDFREVPLEWGGRSEFQRAVWRQCRQIPFGQVLTYAKLAKRLGSPRSARAVGNAMAANPIPLIVPCHRIVASGGTLGGFSAPGGLDMKRRLLELETSATPMKSK